MTTATFHLDLSRFPLVVLSLAGQLDGRQHERMFADLEAMGSRGEPYVMITDLSRARLPSAAQRQLTSDWAAHFETNYGHLSRGSIMIVPSPTIRAAMTAINWVARKKNKDILVGDMEQALAKARTIVEETGLSVLDFQHDSGSGAQASRSQ